MKFLQQGVHLITNSWPTPNSWFNTPHNGLSLYHLNNLLLSTSVGIFSSLISWLFFEAGTVEHAVIFYSVLTFYSFFRSDFFIPINFGDLFSVLFPWMWVFVLQETSLITQDSLSEQTWLHRYFQLLPLCCNYQRAVCDLANVENAGLYDTSFSPFK